jgi:hypothetical protein
MLNDVFYTSCIPVMALSQQRNSPDTKPHFLTNVVSYDNYVVRLADELWILHAFQKKSRRGIKTPEHEVDLVRDRLKKLKEMLR